MPTIAADSRDWLTAFNASPQGERFRNSTSPISIAMPAPPANTRSQPSTRSPTTATPGQNDGGRSGYGP